MSYNIGPADASWFPSSENTECAQQPQPAASPPITERQRECLSWVQEGKSASDIGGILGISSRTVEGHLQKVCEQFGVRTRVQAVLKARDLGLITSRP